MSCGFELSFFVSFTVVFFLCDGVSIFKILTTAYESSVKWSYKGFRNQNIFQP